MDAKMNAKLEEKVEARKDARVVLTTQRNVNYSPIQILDDDATVCRMLYFAGKEVAKFLTSKTAVVILDYLITAYKPDRPHIFKSVSLLAKETNSSPKTVQRAIKALWWWGLVDFVKFKDLDEETVANVMEAMGIPNFGQPIETNLWVLKETAGVLSIFYSLLDLVDFPLWHKTITQTLEWVNNEFYRWLERIGKRPSDLANVSWKEIKASTPFKEGTPVGGYLTLLTAFLLGEDYVNPAEVIPKLIKTLLTKGFATSENLVKSIKAFGNNYEEFADVANYLVELLNNVPTKNTDKQVKQTTEKIKPKHQQKQKSTPKKETPAQKPYPLDKLDETQAKELELMMVKDGIKNPIAFLRSLSKDELVSYFASLFQKYELVSERYVNGLIRGVVSLEDFVKFALDARSLASSTQMPKSIAERKGLRWKILYHLALPDRELLIRDRHNHVKFLTFDLVVGAISKLAGNVLRGQNIVKEIEDGKLTPAEEFLVQIFVKNGWINKDGSLTSDGKRMLIEGLKIAVGFDTNPYRIKNLKKYLELLEKK